MPIDNTIPGFSTLRPEHFELAAEYFKENIFDDKCSRKENHTLKTDNSFIIDRDTGQIFALEDTHSDRTEASEAGSEGAHKATKAPIDSLEKPINYLGQGATARVKKAQTISGDVYAARIARENADSQMLSEMILKDLKKLHAVVVRSSTTTKRFFAIKKGSDKPVEKRYHFLKLEKGVDLFDFTIPHYKGNPFSITDRLGIILEIMKELKVLHDKDIIHRDIKPDNIMIIKEKGNYHIAFVDFQSAVYVSPSKKTYSQKEAVGTAPFLAPELNVRSLIKAQKNSRLYSKASDIFALGILCTGGSLFKSFPAQESFYHQTYKSCDGLFSPKEIGGSPELITLFAPMVAIESKDRPPIDELIGRCEHAIDALSKSTPPVLQTSNFSPSPSTPFLSGASPTKGHSIKPDLK